MANKFWIGCSVWVGVIILVVALVTPHFHTRPDFEFVQFAQVTTDKDFTAAFLYPLANFDGIHYLQIAREGYSDQGRFLPVYPFLVKGIASLFGVSRVSSGVYFLLALGANLVLFPVLLWVWREVFRHDYSNETSDWSLWLFLSFPTAFFLVTVYSETIFLLLIGTTIFLVQKNKWWWAVLSAGLLSITRVPGIMIGVFMIIELWQMRNKINRKQLGMRSMSLLLIPLPLLLYASYNYVSWGSWSYFLEAHAALANSREVGVVFPLITLYRYARILISLSPVLFEFKVALFELLVFLGGSAALVWAWFKKVKPEYVLFAAAAFLLPALSGTFTGLPRYALVLLPILPAVAESLTQEAKIAWISTGLLFQVVLLIAFSLGYFVG